jgi:heme oxygenase (mycobilin-producing)
VSAPGVFRVLLRMETLPGAEAEFERQWAAGAALIAAEPANIGQCLARGDEEHVYYIVSDWTDEERFREYERSERHRDHRSRLHPYRAAGSMATMQVVSELPGAGGGRA